MKCKSSHRKKEENRKKVNGNDGSKVFLCQVQITVNRRVRG